MHKKIDQYQIVDSLDTAFLLIDKWIEQYFPKNRFDISKEKIGKEDFLYKYKSKKPDASGYYDEGFMKIYEPTPLSKDNIEEIFKPEQKFY